MFSFTRTANGVAFWIRVTPRAKRSAVGGSHADALRVRVTVPPAEGAANAACVRALAEALGIQRADVDLDPGSKSRRKRVRIAGDPDVLGPRLCALAEEGSND